MKKYLVLIPLLLVFFSIALQAQSSYCVVTKSSTIEVTGTSTLHDWEMKSTDIVGKSSFTIVNGELSSITATEVSCAANQLKSHSSKMDDYAYEALKAETAPTLSFSLNSISNLKSIKGEFTATINGSLKIAGKTNTISVPLKGKITPTNEITVSTDIELLMTTYDMEPPKVMFGTISCGDKITLHVNLTFSKCN